jgi:hypothetical protein
MVPARILMVASAVIALTLGGYHLYFTFRGPLLTPRDPAVQTAMAQTAPVISPDTTMWRLWLGFNASHSMGLILFGLVFGYLALAHARTLFSSPFLLAVGLAMLTGMAILCKLYFFSAPLRSIEIAWLCYFAAIFASRILPAQY